MYLQHNYDFPVADTLFQITLKPDAELKEQRNTKVPTNFREYLQTISDELETKGIIERVGLDAARSFQLPSDFTNPIVILPKGDTSKIVIVASLLNAIFDISKQHFPLILVHVFIPRINGTIFSTTDLSIAFH